MQMLRFYGSKSMMGQHTVFFSRTLFQKKKQRFLSYLMTDLPFAFSPRFTMQSTVNTFCMFFDDVAKEKLQLEGLL